ncbi:urease accessory protein [Entomortierella parvispora]|uniref:Urease accessory protein n=1 Tax=Entomortierella parvispora TaxID=205924 RepID=A0A9P3H0I0_9FUNG|nr:urease accessory protein [Entomortierella parvispora]
MDTPMSPPPSELATPAGQKGGAQPIMAIPANGSILDGPSFINPDPSLISEALPPDAATLLSTVPAPAATSSQTQVSTPSWLLWQFLDSALPTGGFIASNGLEAFAKLHPNDSKSVQQIEAYIHWSVHACGYTNLPFVTEVWNLVDQWTIRDAFELKTEKGKSKAMRSVLKRIANVDREYDVFMNNAIQNAASRKQGDGMIMMGVKCFADQYKTGSAQDEEEDEDGVALGANIRILKPFKAMLRSEELAGHYPIAFSMMARLLGFDLATTRYLHLHLHARTLLSSAIRLALLGPFQAQHIMTRAQSKARFIDAKTADLKIEDAAQTFLVGDICSGIHGRLWTRLFNS